MPGESKSATPCKTAIKSGDIALVALSKKPASTIAVVADWIMSGESISKGTSGSIIGETAISGISSSIISSSIGAASGIGASAIGSSAGIAGRVSGPPVANKSLSFWLSCITNDSSSSSGICASSAGE